jgi:NAD(P)-dependent dehydrogenase (short-subunit alcohol dehydrogenase family)
MIAFITGATRGIGLELTKILVEREYDVIATGRDTKGSKQLSSLKADYPENLTLIDLDVTHDHKISDLPGELAGFSHIDLLINNAGMFTDDDNHPLERINPASALKTFMVNTMGPLKVTQVLLPKLKKSKNPIVVSVTSQMGSIDDNKMGRYYGYRMSKAALNMMTKSLSIDYPEMTSIVIHPGWVKTDMGGPEAPVEPHDSAMGIMNVIEKLQKKDSGKFYNFKGQTLPW